MTLGAIVTARRAAAQPAAGKVPKLGFLVPGQPSARISLTNTEAFRQGLRDHGYVEGQSIAIEYRYGNLVAWPNAVNDLIRLKVDMIIAGGTPPALAAKRATTTIPIVVAAMADPVADGLVASLGRPRGNVTGGTFLAPDLGPKRFQLLREVVPAVTRIAVLEQPGAYGDRTMRNMLRDMEAAAQAGGVELQVVDASSPNDFDRAFAAMAKAHADAFIMIPSPMLYWEYRRLVDLAANHRLPAIYLFREAVEAGGLMCYGADIPDLFRRAATFVDKILKGAKPADLPVEQPTKFELVINMKTAKALGLTIPHSVLLRAAQVIE
jgi:putative tryptophan/tyrosine transport system substrate-binding protein